MWDGIQSWLFEMRADICLAGLILLGMTYITKPKKELWLVGGLAAIAFFTATRFGQFQPEGIHVHDVFHYQFGSKYAAENGYTGIYEATAVGLQELVAEKKIPPGHAPSRIRSLEDKAGEQIPVDEKLKEKVKARFSEEKWTTLKKDLLGYENIYHLPWQRVVDDAGYNPTPWWSLLGATVNLALPNPESYRQVKYIDAAFLLACLIMVWQTFGLRPALYAAALTFFFPPGRFAPFDYTGASMLRLSWVFWVTAGLCAFQTKRFALAGIALGLATMERVFPGAFALAAGATTVAMAIGGNPKKLEAWMPAVKLATGGIAAAAFAYGASCLAYGPNLWSEFIRFIPQHTSLLFTNHVGWGKAISIHPHMNDVAFSKENMAVLKGWSEILLSRNSWLIFMVAKTLLLGGVTIWALRKKDTTGIALLGATIVFFFSMPAHYYLFGMIGIYASGFASDEKAGKASLGAWMIFTGAACTLLLGTGETVGWVASSAAIALGIAYGCGTLCWPTKQWAGGLMGAACWLLVLAYPQMSTAAGKEQFPAKIHAKAPTITRRFIDETAREIRDKGIIIGEGQTAEIKTETRGQHSIHIRTDRAFPGTLELQDPSGNPIYSWKVAGRGSIFETLSGPLPKGETFKVKWSGGKDIGIFSVWTESNGKGGPDIVPANYVKLPKAEPWPTSSN